MTSQRRLLSLALLASGPFVAIASPPTGPILDLASIGQTGFGISQNSFARWINPDGKSFVFETSGQNSMTGQDQLGPHAIFQVLAGGGRTGVSAAELPLPYSWGAVQTQDTTMTATGKFVFPAFRWTDGQYDVISYDPSNGQTDILTNDELGNRMTETNMQSRVGLSGDKLVWTRLTNLGSNARTWVRDIPKNKTFNISVGPYSYYEDSDAEVNHVLLWETANFLNNLLFMVDTSTGARTLVPGNAARGKLSPNGRYVAFSPTTYDQVLANHIVLWDSVTNVMTDVASTTTYQGGMWIHGVSDDGRFVLFASRGLDLVPGITLGIFEYFVKDMQNGTIRCITAPGGVQSESPGGTPYMSKDGRFVFFSSPRSNYGPSDPNGSLMDVYRYDRLNNNYQFLTGTTKATVAQSTTDCDVSESGGVAIWRTNEPNMVPGDANGQFDVFIRNMTTNQTRRMAPAGIDPAGETTHPSLSADGTLTSFEYNGTDFVAGLPTPNQVYTYKTSNGAVNLVSANAASAPGNGASFDPRTAAFGKYVAFASYAKNLALPAGPVGVSQIYLKNLTTGAVANASTRTNGKASLSDAFKPAVSSTGRFVVFAAKDVNLTNAPNGELKVFHKDLQTGHLSVLPTMPPLATTLDAVIATTISADGRYIGYTVQTDGYLKSSAVYDIKNHVFTLDWTPGTLQRMTSQATYLLMTLGYPLSFNDDPVAVSLPSGVIRKAVPTQLDPNYANSPINGPYMAYAPYLGTMYRAQVRP